MIDWLFGGRRERVRRRAAAWIAKLNGPHGERERAAFGRWYHAHPDHAAAFDRQSALFDLAEGIRPVERVVTLDPPARRTGRTGSARNAFAAVATASAIVVLAFAVLAGRDMVRPAQDGVQVALFVATVSENRRLRLVDGSDVVLTPGSELAVAIDGDARRLQLRRGEGRFTVFHDTRPFIVTAAGTEIVARGTQFVVRMAERATLVALIEGRVDISYPPSADGSVRRVASLAPGQRLVVPVAVATPTSSVAGSVPEPVGMIALDDTRLAEAIEQMNRSVDRPLRLGDAALADLRVTGAFRAGDADGFADGVAAALDLEVERASDGTLVLRGSREGAPRP